MKCVLRRQGLRSRQLTLNRKLRGSARGSGCCFWSIVLHLHCSRFHPIRCRRQAEAVTECSCCKLLVFVEKFIWTVLQNIWTTTSRKTPSKQRFHKKVPVPVYLSRTWGHHVSGRWLLLIINQEKLCFYFIHLHILKWGNRHDWGSPWHHPHQVFITGKTRTYFRLKTKHLSSTFFRCL